MILAVSTYLRPLDDVDAQRPAHHAFLSKLESRGVLVIAGRQRPPVGAVLVLCCEDVSQARELLDADPYVEHSLASYTYTEFIAARGLLTE